MNDEDFASLMKWLTVIALFAMVLPMFLAPLPKFVINNDVTYHYRLTQLISENVRNIAVDNYPKLYHLSAALLSNTFGFQTANAMQIVTLFFALLLPIYAYKLSFLALRNKKISALTAFLSVATVVVNSQLLTGLSITTPLVPAVTLFVATLYYYMNKRYVYSGIFLALQFLMHNSWPLTIIFIVLYTFAKSFKDLRIFRKLLFVAAFAAVISAPMAGYIISRSTVDAYAQDFMHLSPDVPISILYLPLLYFPFVAAALPFVFGLYRAVRRKTNFNTKFLALLSIVILLATQSYFFYNFLPTISTTLFVSSRFQSFIIFFVAFFGALYLSKFSNKKLVAFCVLFLVTSSVQYYEWYSARLHAIDQSDIGMISILQQVSPSKKPILFDPLHRFDATEFVVNMGGHYTAPGSDELTRSYLIFSGLVNLDNSFSHVIVGKGDATAEKFVEKNFNALRIVSENEKYQFYEIVTNETPKQLSFSDFVDSFVIYYNNHPRVQALQFSTSVKIISTDSKEEICIEFDNSANVTDCSSPQIVISGKESYLQELFSTYSIQEFSYRFVNFYEQGNVDIAANENADVTVEPFNLGRRFVGSAIYMTDKNSAVVISEGDRGPILKIVYSQEPVGASFTSKFLARTVKWVNLNVPNTYPNVLFGAAYAEACELLKGCG